METTTRVIFVMIAGAAGVGLVVVAVVATVLLVRGGPASDRADYCWVLDEPEGEVGIVFVEPDASAEEIAEVGEALAALDDVHDLTPVDQAEAYEEAMELFDGTAMADSMTPELLPTSWRFGMTEPSTRDAVWQSLDDVTQVKEIQISRTGTAARGC